MSRKDVPDEAVVRAALDFHRERAEPFVNERLVRSTGQPLKVCDAAISRAMERGLVDCGVSERTCWATRAGRLLVGAAS